MAIRWTNTSLSVVLWNRQPRRTSALRRATGVGEVAVMADGEAAELEIGVERLHVAQDGVAGGGVAVVADGAGAGQRGDHPGVAEIVADQAEAALLVEAVAVIADDAGGFLAAVLQRVQAERGDGRGVDDVPDAEDAALLVQLVVVARLCGAVRVRSSSAVSYSRSGGAGGARPGIACSRSAVRVAARRRRVDMRAVAPAGSRASHRHPDRRAARLRASCTGSGQRSVGISHATAI